MSDHVLLNLLSKLGKRPHVRLVMHFISFCYKFNNLKKNRSLNSNVRLFCSSEVLEWGWSVIVRSHFHRNIFLKSVSQQL